MILYESGAAYWHEMRKFNANKQLPGMVLHTVEKMEELHERTTSAAVKRRIASFIARHAPRKPAPVAPA